MRLLIAVAYPYSGMISRECYKALEGTASIRGVGVDVLKARGALVSHARNRAVRAAIDTNYDQVLFVDADMVFTNETVTTISQLCEKECVVGGGYVGRDNPAYLCAGEWGVVPGTTPGSARVRVGATRGIYNVKWVGAGFLCVDVGFLRDKMAMPYFSHNRIDLGDDGFIESSEDVGFCMNVASVGGRVNLAVSLPGLVHRPMNLPEVCPDIDLRDWKVDFDKVMTIAKALGNSLADNMSALHKSVSGD